MHVLSAGACRPLSQCFAQLGVVSWRWSWPWLALAAAVVLCRGTAAVLGPLLLLWVGAAVYLVDFEVALCGHWTALWVACLTGLSAIVQCALGWGSAVCVGFLAGLAGAVVVGLLWSVQVFESAQWWSIADAAEGASLVLLALVAGAAHGGRPRGWRVAAALWLLGTLAVYEPDGAFEVFVVVHRWAV